MFKVVSDSRIKGFLEYLSNQAIMAGKGEAILGVLERTSGGGSVSAAGLLRLEDNEQAEMLRGVADGLMEAGKLEQPVAVGIAFNAGEHLHLRVIDAFGEQVVSALAEIAHGEDLANRMAAEGEYDPEQNKTDKVLGAFLSALMEQTYAKLHLQ